jgi:hypothetical protein
MLNHRHFLINQSSITVVHCCSTTDQVVTFTYLRLDRNLGQLKCTHVKRDWMLIHEVNSLYARRISGIGCSCVSEHFFLANCV